MMYDCLQSTRVPWVVGWMALSWWILPSSAQELPAAAGLALFVEPVEPVIRPTDRYGTVAGASFRKWRPMCGSSEGLTERQFRDLIAAHAALEAQSGGPRSTRGTGMNITFSFSPSVPLAVSNALQSVATFIESQFGDNLTMNISVDWQSMGGGVLGATGSFESNLSYASVRDSLVDDMDIDDSIQAELPGGTTVPVRYDEARSDVTDEDTVALTWGNLKALGGGPPNTVASMTFNSGFNWDFDPSNGINAGAYDFRSVAVHEVGHAMGFVSDVDDDCSGAAHTLAVMDLFRFRDTDGCCDYDPDTLAEFTVTPRLVDCNAPNDAHTTDLISAEYRMSDGSPSQASHFRFSVDAIMDPSIAAGESFYPDFFRAPDMAVLDAIGWDTPVEPDYIVLPIFEHFPALVLDSEVWLGIEGASASTRGRNEPSPELSLRLSGSSTGGNEVRTAFIDTTDLNDLVLNFYYEPGGTDEPPDVGDDLVFEYWNGDGNWVEVVSFTGDGASDSDYAFVSVPLPAAASHPEFRLRVRAVSDEPGNDNWFVDNLCLGSAAFCAEPFECITAADCDDGVACTVESCTGGLCGSSADDGACDDGIPCTIDACDPALGGCVHTPSNSLCDDGLACTFGVCSAAAGCLYSANDSLCDDGDPCTSDVCDLEVGCLNPPNEICGGLSLVVEDGSAGCGTPGVGVCTVVVQMPTAADRLLSVGFAAVSTDAVGGFYQIPAAVGGSNTAPSELFLDLFPDLVCDSYVTIGLQFVPTGVTDSTTLDPDFDPDLFNCIDGCGGLVGGWYNADPPNGQGDAANYPDNRVIIAQLAVPQGATVAGDIVVFINDGMTEIPLSFECVTDGCTADLTADGVVDAADLAQLLGAWGINPGSPADLTGNGVVDAADLALLLGSWGPCA